MKPVMDAGKVNCIPTAMPFVDSLFMKREIGDRPDVLVKGATNFAFLANLPKRRKTACLQWSTQREQLRWQCTDYSKQQKK